jgi:hypothetical protein
VVLSVADRSWTVEGGYNGRQRRASAKCFSAPQAVQGDLDEHLSRRSGKSLFTMLFNDLVRERVSLIVTTSLRERVMQTVSPGTHGGAVSSDRARLAALSSGT